MLLERVRRALAPDYEILEEIAGGGMGIVFAARQRRLDRRVAIKILRPEHATAIAVERFLAEGRVLARLAHPNIVPVYDAGEADGLLYYVMEFVEGETLADRLSRGPLPRAEALRLAQDLLNALSAAHALGVVHRDVKPANIFLRDGRALLGDFGIARWREKGEPEYTTPGEMIGTPRYMSPEQRDGLPATARTDVYAAGLVIWEACSGTRWPFYQSPKDADWERLPPALAAPVRRALGLEPEKRWEDAASFAGAIARRPKPRRRILLVGAALAAALVVWAAWPRGPEVPSGGIPLALERIVPQGAVNPAERALVDSAAAYIRDLLTDYPLFYVPPLGQAVRDPRVVRLRGTARIAGGELQLALREEGTPPDGGQAIAARRSGAVGAWQSVADIVAMDLVYQIWRRAESDPSFPLNAIPQSAAGRANFAKGEMFFSLGSWEEARQAYQADSSCLLCVFRLVDIERWFGLPHDTVRLALLKRKSDSFPEQYQPLIYALGAPIPARLDILGKAAATWREFFLASFHYGDELFHRGPLYGRLRADAILPLLNTLLLRPRFYPAREHLAWLLIGEGDRAGARRAVDSLLRRPTVSGLSGALTVLRTLGYYWRFAPDSARQVSAELLRRPEIIRNPDAAAGARLLMTMEAPQGAVELGRMFTEWPGREDAVLPGLLGQLYGYAALGRLDSLRAIGERFARSSADPSYRLLALELEAVLRSFDPDSGASDAGSLREELTSQVRSLAADPALRRRASWALGLMAAASGDQAAFALARNGLRDEPEPAPLGKILDAALLGRKDFRRALGLLLPVPTLDQEGAEYVDPLEDAVVHLLRAEWQGRGEDLSQASRTLRWHEHSQISGHLTGPPQPGEMAWALGTLARWKRAKLLSALGDEGAEWCSVNRGIARLWADGDPPFRARADSARRALAVPACAASP